LTYYDQLNDCIECDEVLRLAVLGNPRFAALLSHVANQADTLESLRLQFYQFVLAALAPPVEKPIEQVPEKPVKEFVN
jgi:hypothetical protein